MAHDFPLLLKVDSSLRQPISKDSLEPRPSSPPDLRRIALRGGILTWVKRDRIKMASGWLVWCTCDQCKQDENSERQSCYFWIFPVDLFCLVMNIDKPWLSFFRYLTHDQLVGFIFLADCPSEEVGLWLHHLTTKKTPSFGMCNCRKRLRTPRFTISTANVKLLYSLSSVDTYFEDRHLDPDGGGGGGLASDAIFERSWRGKPDKYRRICMSPPPLSLSTILLK